jgi:hypothetical protein
MTFVKSPAVDCVEVNMKRAFITDVAIAEIDKSMIDHEMLLHSNKRLVD